MVFEAEQLKKETAESVGLSGSITVCIYECSGPHKGDFLIVQSPLGLCAESGWNPDWGRVKDGVLGMGSASGTIAKGAAIMIGGVFVGFDGPLVELAGLGVASKGAFDFAASGTVALAGLAGLDGSEDPFNTTILTTAAGLTGDNQTINGVATGESVFDYLIGGGGIEGEVGIGNALTP